MTPSALPDNWREILAGYVLGDLDTDERNLVQYWLQQYPVVATELAALEETWNALPQTLRQQDPPDHLSQRLRSAITQPQPVAQRRRQLAVWCLSTGWAATAIALVALGLENQQLRRQKLQAEAVVASFSQPQNHLYTLIGTDAEPQASGRLLIDSATDSALIATQNLPALPKDQAYRLWALAEDDPVFCGQFNPDGAVAVHRWQLANPACQISSVQMLITSESVAAPPVPQGPLVLQTQS